MKITPCYQLKPLHIRSSRQGVVLVALPESGRDLIGFKIFIEKTKILQAATSSEAGSGVSLQFGSLG